MELRDRIHVQQQDAENGDDGDDSDDQEDIFYDSTSSLDALPLGQQGAADQQSTTEHRVSTTCGSASDSKQQQQHQRITNNRPSFSNSEATPENFPPTALPWIHR